MGKLTCDLVVLGAGPGGYAAAFYAADLGREVVLVDSSDQLGGVCLNRGCIPSKALIHATSQIDAAMHSQDRGISFGEPTIDLKKLRDWKNNIVGQLGNGVKALAKQRGIKVIHGKGYFEAEKELRVEQPGEQQFLHFNQCIIAVGSVPALPAQFDLGNKRIMTSTEALDLEDIPKSMLVVGAGYIGLELGFVYASLGSEVTVVEALPGMLAGADPDLVRPVMKKAKGSFKDLRFDTKVLKMATKKKQIEVSFESDNETNKECYDRVLVAIGRRPNSIDLGLDNAGVKQDDKGYILVDDQLQSSNPDIFAIGDIIGGTLLAHKAAKESRIAVDIICGTPNHAKNVMIPAVVFTHPEVAWVGLTEVEAKNTNKNVKIAKFPWTASGRAMSMDDTDGLTKLIVDPDTNRILGMGIVGPHAGELISEGSLAIQMGATVEDLAEVVHPHPTLSETLMEAAEAHLGHATHIMPAKKRATAS
ncbi:MAG: dihydrolipoyl dehydrogenase [Actinobacteria bacterium]|nr:dihydrolipoyl dehydrogenase [Actinomycetota bacterium]